jgi:prepilin-type N-terminal cleavage/methylation domain-containing protein
MTNKREIAGFTLIEMVVVALLLGILSMGAYSLFLMKVDTKRETEVNLRKQRQAEALIDEIARRVRMGTFVLGPDDDRSNPASFIEVDPDNDSGFTEIPRKEIIIHGENINGNDSVMVRFRIERIPGTDIGEVVMCSGTAAVTGSGCNQRFIVGGAPVQVVYDDSWFGLWHGRVQVNIALTLRTTARNGDVFTLAVQRGAFRCRNRWID